MAGSLGFKLFPFIIYPNATNSLVGGDRITSDLFKATQPAFAIINAAGHPICCSTCYRREYHEGRADIQSSPSFKALRKAARNMTHEMHDVKSQLHDIKAQSCDVHANNILKWGIV